MTGFLHKICRSQCHDIRPRRHTPGTCGESWGSSAVLYPGALGVKDENLSHNLSLLITMFRSISRFTLQKLDCSLYGATISRRYAHAPATLNWEDPLSASSLFTEDELAIQETARSYCQERMLPRVLGGCCFQDRCEEGLLGSV